jgi:hypothetical protein
MSAELRGEIVKFLGSGASVTAKDIAAEISADLGVVKTALKVLTDRHVVRRIDRPSDPPLFVLQRRRASREYRPDHGATVQRTRPRLGAMG